MTDLHCGFVSVDPTNNTGNDVPRRISNSETSAFLQCERKWYYQYKLNLEPVTTGQALSRGIIGHECLAAYYTVLKDSPSSFVEAERAAFATLAPYFTAGFDVAMLTQLNELLTRYFGYSRADNWEILAVEQSYDIDVNESFGYVMRLDLLAGIKGKKVLVDHKFTYTHYDQNVLDMNVQIPKYIGALRFNKEDVDYAMLNQILYRTKKGGYTDEETFQRVVLRPSPVEIKNVMREQFRASEQIMKFYADPDAEANVLRTMNQMSCRNCSMAKICKADLMGQDTTDIILSDYRPNSYGYNKDELAEV